MARSATNGTMAMSLTPRAADFNGSDSFTYTITDGSVPAIPRPCHMSTVDAVNADAAGRQSMTLASTTEDTAGYG